MEWYPEDKKKLNDMLDGFIDIESGKEKKQKEIHGIIVPHAGYVYSGEVAGKVYSLLGKINKVVVIGPSHYAYLSGIVAGNKDFETPLGKVKLITGGFNVGEIGKEHSIANQIPFLQKIGCKEILALMVGEIDNNLAKETAEKLAKIDCKFVFSTDLSHFLSYVIAVKQDKKTIEIIENLDFKNFSQIDACGKAGLLILFYLCKLKGWKPKLIEYKNSGDVTGERRGVVGYASFVF